MHPDQQKLLGVWRLTRIQTAGKIMTTVDEFAIIGSTYEFTDRWLFTIEHGRVGKHRYRLNPEPNPPHLDTHGSQLQPYTLGIYRFDGPTLILNAGTKQFRPTTFDTSTGKEWLHFYEKIAAPTPDAERHYKKRIRGQLAQHIEEHFGDSAKED